MWSQFCSRKPNYKHAIACKNDIAYTFYGQPNPTPPGLIILDSDGVPDSPSPSPPAQQTTLHVASPHFGILDSKESTGFQQKAILAKQVKCSDTGSQSLSMRPKPAKTPISKKLSSMKQKFSIMIIVCLRDLINPKYAVYDN
jgi:hypothetical protein